MPTINGINIDNRETLNKYFDFEALYQQCIQNPVSYIELSQKLYAPDRFPIDKQVEVAIQAYKKGRAKLSELSGNQGGPQTWTCEGETVCCNTEMLGNYMQTLCDGDRSKDVVAYRQSIPPLLEAVEEHNPMSLDTAWKVLFMLYLHLQARRQIPGELVEKLFANGETADGDGMVLRYQADTTLPFYEGGQSGGSPLRVKKLVNDADRAITLSLGRTTLRRRLLPGDAIYALQKNGGFVLFLPRVVFCNEVISYMAEDMLLLESREGRSVPVSPDIFPAVTWGLNDDRFLLAGESGKLDPSFNIPEDVPESPIVYVNADVNNYCMIDENGKAWSGYNRYPWEHIVCCDLCSDAGIAIDDSRAVLLGGSLGGDASPVGRNAVQAACMSNHYIWMDKQGDVYTEAGPLEGVDEKARGVAICERGYVVATDSAIFVIDFNGVGLSCPVDSFDGEIAAWGKDIAYFSTAKGWPVYLKQTDTPPVIPPANQGKFRRPSAEPGMFEAFMNAFFRNDKERT